MDPTPRGHSSISTFSVRLSRTAHRSSGLHGEPGDAMNGRPSRERDSMHVMTQLLEQAIVNVRDLPDERQDMIARIILEEVEAARRWDDTFERTGDQLATLARRVLADDERGETVERGWDEL